MKVGPIQNKLCNNYQAADEISALLTIPFDKKNKSYFQIPVKIPLLIMEI